MARSPKDITTSTTSGPKSIEPTGGPTPDSQDERTISRSSHGTTEEVTPDDQTSGGIEPDEEAVRQLAYEIWEREGKQPDRDQEYWQRAKELLRARPA